MKSVLTSKVKENEIIVVDSLSFEAPKTKEMVKVLKAINADKKALIVTVDADTNVIKSASNIPNVQTAMAANLNVYDILKYNSFIVTKDALEKISEVFA